MTSAIVCSLKKQYDEQSIEGEGKKFSLYYDVGR